MTVLTKYRPAYEAMYAAAVAARDQEDAARETAVREAFRASGCDEARESALIYAPQEMSDVLEHACATLWDLQDVFVSGDAAMRRDLERAE